MPTDDFEHSPVSRLAVAYAPANVRTALSLLLSFDDRLSDIVGRASEPMIAQMKLAWWSDAILREPAARPRGEPIFQVLSELSVADVDAAMLQLLDAWGLLLSVDDWTQDILERFGRQRSAAIFGSYAKWVRSDEDVLAMGEAWALSDLQGRFGARVTYRPSVVKPIERTTRRLRSLSILAYSAANPSGIGMIWHALTGR